MTVNSMALATAGAVTAAVAGGPLAAVFNELSLTLAIMGGAGGLTWGLATRQPWLDVVRGVIIGALVAVGFYQLYPEILDRIFNIKIDVGETAAPVSAAIAYLVGFFQDAITRWARTIEPKKNGGDNA